MLSCCSQWEKGAALLIQSFSPIESPICIANVEEEGMTEKEEDDEGAILFFYFLFIYTDKKLLKLLQYWKLHSSLLS